MESFGKIHQSDGCSELQPSSFIDPIQGLQAQLQIWSSIPGAITLSSLPPLSYSSPFFPNYTFSRCTCDSPPPPASLLRRFVTIYHGPSHTYKVQRLTESSSYTFRIQSISEAGEGPFSNTQTFCTTKSVPPVLKGTIKTHLLVHDSWRIPPFRQTSLFKAELIKC